MTPPILSITSFASIGSNPHALRKYRHIWQLQPRHQQTPYCDYANIETTAAAKSQPTQVAAHRRSIHFAEQHLDPATSNNNSQQQPNNNNSTTMPLLMRSMIGMGTTMMPSRVRAREEIEDDNSSSSVTPVGVAMVPWQGGNGTTTSNNHMNMTGMPTSGRALLRRKKRKAIPMRTWIARCHPDDRYRNADEHAQMTSPQRKLYAAADAFIPHRITTTRQTRRGRRRGTDESLRGLSFSPQSPRRGHHVL